MRERQKPEAKNINIRFAEKYTRRNQRKGTYWIRKYAKEIGKKNVSNERVKVIEMDELYIFSERKKQNLRDDTSK